MIRPRSMESHMPRFHLLVTILVTIATLGLASSAAAHYNPTQGRWLERDPIGSSPSVSPSKAANPAIAYAMGASLVQFVRSQPGSLKDPTGLMDDGHGIDSDYCRRAYAACMVAMRNSHAACKPILDNCDEENFLDWVRRESRSKDWANEIASCPCTLAGAEGERYRHKGVERVRNPNPYPGDRPDGWNGSSEIEVETACPSWSCSSMLVDRYHPGATTCCRQTSPSPHPTAGQQCCYDANGELITSGSGAGTADRGRPGPPYWWTKHDRWDVVPFDSAEELDRLRGGSYYRELYARARPQDNRRGCKDNPSPWVSR